MVDLINPTLHEEMRRNPRIMVFGEDVADCSREDNLCEVKGKGGVFKATAGLQTRIRRRALLQYAARRSLHRRAAPSAWPTRGLKPVAEIQFFDYIWPAMMQIRDELATLRWRSNGGFSAPAGDSRADRRLSERRRDLSQPVRRSDVHPHSRPARGDSRRTRWMPAGCCARRIRCDDPVLFLEHKNLYREPYNRSPHPGPDFTIPFGKASVVKPGRISTIVTYGALVQKSLLAATQVEQRDPGRQHRNDRSAHACRPTTGRPSERRSRRPAA